MGSRRQRSSLPPGSRTRHEVGGTVVAVQDGDTVTILDAARVQHRVRIAGIDAPESRQATARCRSRASPVSSTAGTSAAHCPKRDRFGREVCNVFVAPATSGSSRFGAAYAWWYREYAREQAPEDRATYEAAEERGAKAARRGPVARPGAAAASACRRQNGRAARPPEPRTRSLERVSGTKRTGIVRR